jgi:hypothetical protein
MECKSEFFLFNEIDSHEERSFSQINSIATTHILLSVTTFFPKVTENRIHSL